LASGFFGGGRRTANGGEPLPFREWWEEHQREHLSVIGVGFKEKKQKKIKSKPYELVYRAPSKEILI